MVQANMTPDPWQVDLLRSSDRRVLILASRQTGKSQTAGALALREALLWPGALVLLLSPTLRQSGELFRDKVLPMYAAFKGAPKANRETALELGLETGSRIISLPGVESTIRGYANVRLLIIDEAARVPDSLYEAVRPMLAVSGGAIVCLSSAYAQQGFFYDAYTNGGDVWKRVKVTAEECGRISPAFLAEERAALGERIFEREYCGVFTSADDAVFDPGAIARALAARPSADPLF